MEIKFVLKQQENFGKQKLFAGRRRKERNPVVQETAERDDFLDTLKKSLKRSRDFSLPVGQEREDIKRIMAVYYEQNVTSEKFKDFDGNGGSSRTIGAGTVSPYLSEFCCMMSMEV